MMPMMISLILVIMGLGLFMFLLVLGDEDDTLNKIMDESCYYCIFSKTPHSIRDKTKNTCKIINNKHYNSTMIRYCKYRCKK